MTYKTRLLAAATMIGISTILRDRQTTGNVLYDLALRLNPALDNAEVINTLAEMKAHELVGGYVRTSDGLAAWKLNQN